MSVTVFVSALLCTASSVAESQLDEAALLARAEVAFRQGVRERSEPKQARKRFAEAADAYQALHERGVRNADLYRNLGHASLLAERLPEAILAYRRGLRLAPQDGSLQEDLASVRDQVRYPFGQHGRPAAEPWPSWLPRPTDGLLLGLTFGLYGVACAAATRWLMTGRSGPLLLAGATLFLALPPGLGWGVLVWQDWQDERFPLVVIAAGEVHLYKGNGLTYPRHDELPALSRGMEARLRFARGDWLQIQLPDGEIGWVERRNVLIDDP